MNEGGGKSQSKKKIKKNPEYFRVLYTVSRRWHSSQIAICTYAYLRNGLNKIVYLQ